MQTPGTETQLNKNLAADYIIAGAGCAGLSLLLRLVDSGKFRDKKILLVDKEAKNKNDRTWCFWQKEAGLFEPIIFKQWQQLWFHAKGFSKELAIAPYSYKLIRGIDFYNYCWEIIKQQPNVTFIQSPVTEVFSSAARGTGVVAGGITYYSQYVFNSILFSKPTLQPHQYWLLQHFKGWVVQTPTPAFDAGTGTLMDFRTSQSEGATFFYVLPFSPTEALVEYTLFSKNVLKEEAYNNALKNYVSTTLGIQDYTIAEEEFGVIPMSNFRFPVREHHLLHIGTAGGQTKASSGYTFNFIQKHSAAIVQSLVQTGHPFNVKKDSRRFHFYDAVLLHLLHYNKLPGAAIFADLFKKNNAAAVLKFLDNETSLPEELRLISTLPTLPFLKAAIRQIAAGL